MEDKLKEAIKAVAEMAVKANNADDALKYTQAATNAANALVALSRVGKP